MSFIIAQAFGVAGLISTITANYQNKKDRILIFQIIANLLCFIQYVLLNALAGASTFFVAIIRCIIFYMFNRKGKEKSTFVLVFFSILIVILGVLSYKDIFSLIPIITAVIYTYGVWQDNLKRFRIIAFIVPLTWIVYNLHVGAFVGVLLTIIEATATLVAIIKLDIKKEKIE